MKPVSRFRKLGADAAGKGLQAIGTLAPAAASASLAACAEKLVEKASSRANPATAQISLAAPDTASDELLTNPVEKRSGAVSDSSDMNRTLSFGFRAMRLLEKLRIVNRDVRADEVDA